MPTTPKSVPIVRSANIMTAGCKDTARLITTGWIKFDSMPCTTRYARTTNNADMGFSTRARRIGGIIEISGPINGTKASRPDKSPSSNANGTPTRNKAIVKSTPITTIETSCPKIHLWMALYILSRISRTLSRRLAGKRATNPLTSGAGCKTAKMVATRITPAKERMLATFAPTPTTVETVSPERKLWAELKSCCTLGMILVSSPNALCTSSARSCALERRVGNDSISCWT